MAVHPIGGFVSLSATASGTGSMALSIPALSGSGSMSVGGLWGNEPGSYTRIIDKQCGSTNMGTDDILNNANWFHSDGTPTVVTDETGEPASPNTAYRATFNNGTENGAAWQQVGAYTMDEWYFGVTFKLSADWENTPLSVLKIVWFTLSGGGRYTVLKCDGTGANPEIQFTCEHGEPIGTFNTGGETINRNQWYQIEGQVINPASDGGNGTLRLWLDGVSILNTTHAMSNTDIVEVDLQPYIGGTGTHAGPTMECYIGHLIVSVP